MRIRTQRLPVGYREPSYIKATGGAYIDSGYTLLTSKSWKIETMVTFKTRYVRQAIFGNYDNTNTANNYLCCEISGSDKFRLVSYNEDRYSTTTMVVGKPYKLTIYNSSNKVYLKIESDGVDETSNYVTFIDNLRPELFFRDYRTGVFNSEVVECSYMKIYENNDLIKNYIPCYDLTQEEA